MKTFLLKAYESRYYFLILFLGYLLFCGIGVYFIDYYNQNQLVEILKVWMPQLLKFNFFLFLIAAPICYRDFIDIIKKFNQKQVLFLIVFFVFCFLLVCFLPARTHRIYFDEDIYANVAQTIMLSGQSGYCNYGTFEYEEYYPTWLTYNKEPSGWPFIMSLAFKFFGTDELYAFFTNNFLFAGNVLIVFFITWHLTSSFVASVFAGIILAFMPHHLIWSNTIASEPCSQFFGGLVVLCLVVFLKTGKNRHFLPAAILIPFASQMRPESILICVWAAIAILVISPRSLKERAIWTYGLITLFFLIPHFIHIYAMSGDSWGASGSKFAWEYVPKNASVNTMYYFKNEFFPVVFTIFALAGIFLSLKYWKWKLVLLVWFFLFWGIFIGFYAGSYQYGADVRFALLSFMPIAVFAGLFCKSVSDWTSGHTKHKVVMFAIFFIAAYSFFDFMPLVRRVGQEAWGARYDHYYAKTFLDKIPNRSIVLTHIPTMFLLWNQNAIQTYAGVNNPDIIDFLMKKYFGHVYFHYNYWCNAKSDPNQKTCQLILENYRTEEVARATEQDFNYVLYRLYKKDSNP